MEWYPGFATQEDLNAAYDLASAVPDFAECGAFFRENSAHARETLPSALDQRFGPTLEEYVDVFPAAEPDAPVLVYIHGGYWRRQTAKEFSFVAKGFTALGFTVVVTNYALCPKVTIREITRQSRAALAWVYQNISEYNGDQTRIFVSGHSAGGQQTMRVGVTDWVGDYGLPADLVRGIIPISGVFDLRPLPYSYLATHLRLDMETIRLESPMLHGPLSAPPILLSVGGQEPGPFRAQTMDYLALCQNAGHAVEFFDQPDRHHFTAIVDLNDSNAPLTQAIKDFAVRHS
jgi:arylformamidase